MSSPNLGTESDADFFNGSFKGGPIAISFMWFFNFLGPILYYMAFKPGTECFNVNLASIGKFGGCWNGATSGTNHGWMFVRVSSGILFGLLWLFSLLAYVKQRGMQKIYFRFIAWMIPLSWIAATWALIAFIIGGT